MRLVILGIISVVSSTQNQKIRAFSNEVIEKLTYNQNHTGLNGDEISSIYNKMNFDQNRETRDKIRFYYTTNNSMSESWENRQVKFETEVYNENAIFNLGTFVCIEEGMYHFTASMHPQPTEDPKEYIGVGIVKNGVRFAYNRGWQG